MPPHTPPCPAPPPSRLSRRDDTAAPLSSRMHSWKVDTTLRRRLEQRRVYSASLERGTEVGDHRALRGMLPPSGGYGPDVPDPVALSAFVQRVGEWDGELKSFRTSLIQNRQREQRHPSSVSTRLGGSQGVWADRIHDHHLLLKEEATAKRRLPDNGDDSATSPRHQSHEDNHTFLTSVTTIGALPLDPDRPLYDSPVSRAQRSKALRDRTLKSSASRIRSSTVPTPQHLHDITSSPAETKKVIPTVASKEGAAREFWYGGDKPPTPPAFDRNKEVEFQRLLQPVPRPHLPTRTPSATHSRSSREMFTRKRTKSHWYDFEGSQLAAHASHLLESTHFKSPQAPPLFPSSPASRTTGRPPRVGPMSLTYPFPMF